MSNRLLHDVDLDGSRHTRAGGVTASYRWLAAAREVRGLLHFGADAEGLPGHVHGGALSAAVDEAMGMACWCEGYCAPGVRVAAEFLLPLRPGATALLTARLLRAEGRKLHCSAEIWHAENAAVRATGLFVAVPLVDPAPFAGWPGLERFLP